MCVFLYCHPTIICELKCLVIYYQFWTLRVEMSKCLKVLDNQAGNKDFLSSLRKKTLEGEHSPYQISDNPYRREPYKWSVQEKRCH